MDANGFSNETLTTKKKHNRVIGGKKKKKKQADNLEMPKHNTEVAKACNHSS